MPGRYCNVINKYVDTIRYRETAEDHRDKFKSVCGRKTDRWLLYRHGSPEPLDTARNSQYATQTRGATDEDR